MRLADATVLLYNEEMKKRAEMQTLSDKVRTMETETMESHVMRLSEDKPGASRTFLQDLQEMCRT